MTLVNVAPISSVALKISGSQENIKKVTIQFSALTPHDKPRYTPTQNITFYLSSTGGSDRIVTVDVIFGDVPTLLICPEVFMTFVESVRGAFPNIKLLMFGMDLEKSHPGVWSNFRLFGEDMVQVKNVMGENSMTVTFA